MNRCMRNEFKNIISVSLRYCQQIMRYSWTVPNGFNSGINIFNPITKSKVPLIFRNRHMVKWYICGPTVYDTSHIGHACCYMRFDVIRRILKNFFDIHPIVAMNITDIDDKIIHRSAELSVDYKVLGKKYETSFFKDLNLLNIIPPDVVVRVSDHIPDIVSFIQKLQDSGQTYCASDGSVYFNTRKYERYGKLCPAGGGEGVEAGQGSSKQGQQHAADFAVWKGAKPGEPSWGAPWGAGRPGWHIECSVMASKLFGSELDLHSGGLDLVFPHHENEEAQSCAYHGTTQWVNYWLHSGHLLMNQQKMSKSLKNFIPISEFLESHTADELRMFCLLSHYRSGLDYSNESMKLAVSLCDKIRTFLLDCDAYVKGNWFKGDIQESELQQGLSEAYDTVARSVRDDFNTTDCVTCVQKLISATNKMLYAPTPDTAAACARSPVVVSAVASFVTTTLQSLGLLQHKHQVGVCLANACEKQSGESLCTDRTLEHIINQTMNFRSAVRKAALSSQDKSVKQALLQACDVMREEVKSAGVHVKDDATVSSWSMGIPVRG